eukprot:TRINITY_DN54456_c0_g1_i1.p1 TRINITY_DN54456_c0_g1~~TRINITY_DN54456_c0_g1_i1.p1  ORF type:complete len:211 (-),score=59.65 TRINITY_DN54456_c0_g1_i1:49-681(-)
MLADGEDQDLDGSIDVFRSLESDEFQVEVLPAPGRKRPREESEAEGKSASEPVDDVLAEAEVSDDEDDVRVVLCDQGPRSGSMSYYLGKQWEQPATHDGGTLALLPQAGDEGGEVAAGAALALVTAPDNQAELVEKDESVEETLAKISFQMDQAELADTPWRRMGANLSDHFNFGLSEQEFKDLVKRQVRIRLEARQRRKIGVADGSRRN